MAEDLHPLLRTTAADNVADALRALTSAIDVIAPGIGSVFGQLIGSVIPNLKSERVEVYLTLLGRRLRILDERLETLAERMSQESVALFEEGARAASRSTNRERIRQIAQIVSGGLTADERAAMRGREMMRLLDEVSDVELARLDGLVWRGGRDPREKSNTQLRTELVAKSRAARDEERMFDEMHLVRLERLGLIKRPTQLVPGRPQLSREPPVPKLVQGRTELTALGIRLLESAGLGQATWDGVVAREQA